MVCLGNICRSPMAEGILKEKSQHLNWKIDSAGTSSVHEGETPDYRAVKTLRQHDIDISKQKSRPFSLADFSEFDLILTMDNSNFEKVISLAPSVEATKKVKRILDFIYPDQQEEVPDPYYGGDSGFDSVYSLLDRATDKIIEQYGE